MYQSQFNANIYQGNKMASNDAKYYISPLVGLFEPLSCEDITQSDYDKLINAKNVMLSALNFEESFEIIISNHIDYETYIFKDSFLKSMQGISGQQLTNIRIEANRYISNTLASIYNYLQYGNRSISNITKNNFFNETKSEYFKKNKIFAFMNELRNYTQHYGFAAPAFEIFYGVKEVDGNQYLETKLKPSVILSNLKSDCDFYDYYTTINKNPRLDKIRKDSINNILTDSDTDKQEITVLFRNFLDELWNMHNQIREKVKAEIFSQVTLLKIKGKEILNKESLNYFDGFTIHKFVNGTTSSTVIPVRVLDEYNSIIKKYRSIRLSRMIP